MVSTDIEMGKVEALNNKLTPYHACLRIGFIDYENIVSMSLAKQTVAGTWSRVQSLPINDWAQIESVVEKFISEQ